LDLGERLFKLRKEKNLSQEEVADKLNVTRQTVSKWETNQSTPDFDKILPLCELFEIDVNELITGKQKEKEVIQEEVIQEKVLTKEDVKKQSAEVVSTSVFLYILSIVEILIGIPVLNWNPILVCSCFLLTIAFATSKIIKHYMTIPKFAKTEEENQETKIIKQINGIIGAICTAIYFIISFMTYAWHITWIIFIIDGLICQIVKLIFMLYEKEDKIDE